MGGDIQESFRIFQIFQAYRRPAATTFKNDGVTHFRSISADMTGGRAGVVTSDQSQADDVTSDQSQANDVTAHANASHECVQLTISSLIFRVETKIQAIFRLKLHPA